MPLYAQKFSRLYPRESSNRRGPALDETVQVFFETDLDLETIKYKDLEALLLRALREQYPSWCFIASVPKTASEKARSLFGPATPWGRPWKIDL